MRAVTLCLLVKDDRVLLAMKKRGFGSGKKIEGKFYFINEGSSIDEFDIREI